MKVLLFGSSRVISRRRRNDGAVGSRSMTHHFAVGDRVIVIDAHLSQVLRGNVGTVVQVFPSWLEMCDVQFDTYSGPKIVLSSALAPAPPSDVPPAPPAS